jgi:RNA recognition motif-containing protein
MNSSEEGNQNDANIQEQNDDHQNNDNVPPTIPQQQTTTMMTTTTANSTLYIKNIDWKIKKNLLRRALYSLCTRHGKVIEIITLRKQGLRGQAFVIMDTIESATAVKSNENGFTFFNKDLVIEFAKNNTTNRTTVDIDGNVLRKNKRQRTKQVLAQSTTKKVKEEVMTEE